MLSRLRNIITNWIRSQLSDYRYYETVESKVIVGKHTRLYHPVRLYDTTIGDYSYVGMYSHLKMVTIGKFCSIGPHCAFGWGMHPVHGISTSPMFYSTKNQNGISLSKVDKVAEEARITIGNDVFIGMRVTILDGVSIGDGAVIGAGSLVSKDIPPYAIAVGNPIRILRYRFSEDVIKELLDIKWWEFTDDDLKLVEEHFLDINSFIKMVKSLRS